MPRRKKARKKKARKKKRKWKRKKRKRKWKRKKEMRGHRRRSRPPHASLVPVVRGHRLTGNDPKKTKQKRRQKTRR